MAYSVLTPAGLTINIKAMLEAGVTIDEVNRQLRGSRGVCLQCLLARRQLTQAQAEGLGRGTLQACLDSSFRCGHRRRRWNAQTGAPSTATITVEPHYFHPEPLLDEGGERIQRPCESRSQAHIAFLDWLLGSQRAWCLGGLPNDRSSLVLRELRYRKAAPNWRAPDLAVVRCLGVDPDKVLGAIQREGYLPEHATQTISAIELQLSRISVQEIRQRTNDHAQHFIDVRWVFVERHLAGTGEARKWLDEAGLEAYVIRQEADRSRILGIEILPPPSGFGGASMPSPPLPCLRSLYVQQLAQGYGHHEALARAQGERTALREQAGEATRLNALLRDSHGIALPWETPLAKVRQACEDAQQQELERQQAEARRRTQEAEAERQSLEALWRQQQAEAQRQAELHAEQQRERQKQLAEQHRQREEQRVEQQRCEENQRRQETLWQSVNVVELSRDRGMVTNVPVGHLLRERPGGKIYRYLGRDSLGYRLASVISPGSPAEERPVLDLVYSLKGWHVRPATAEDLC